MRDLAHFEQSAAYSEPERDVLRFAEQWSVKGRVPFLNMDVVFDDARLRAEVPAGELPLRKATDYLPSLLRLIRQKAALLEAAVP